jgi:hypothetical protein
VSELAARSADPSQNGYRNRLRRWWLGVRVALWLCVLPLRLRRRGVTALLRADLHHGGLTASGVDVGPTVRTVLRVCRLRLFSTRVFPRACLREALTLFHVLRDMGHPAEFHIGVRKDGEALAAHSWVTLGGERVVRQTSDPAFRTLYSYPTPRSEPREEHL